MRLDLSDHARRLSGPALGPPKSFTLGEAHSTVSSLLLLPPPTRSRSRQCRSTITGDARSFPRHHEKFGDLHLFPSGWRLFMSATRRESLPLWEVIARKNSPAIRMLLGERNVSNRSRRFDYHCELRAHLDLDARRQRQQRTRPRDFLFYLKIFFPPRSISSIFDFMEAVATGRRRIRSHKLGFSGRT